jgi:hypothetical protein
VERNKFASGFINVVASPHPEGIYPRALASIANDPINFYGSSYAAIRAPRQVAKDDPALHEGYITIWTEVDTTEPSIDKATLDQVAIEDDLKEIFKKRGFNSRTFNYVLDASTHKIAVELLNDQGKTLSARQAGNIFGMAFARLNERGQTYEVTVIPEDDALATVLGLSRIDKIRMVIKRPNPGDHLDTDAAEVLREMEEQNINKDERIFTRQSGTESINLSEANHTRALVASTDGFVESAGRDENGQPDKRSTKEYPKIVKRTLAAGTTFMQALRNEARRFRGT